MSLKYYNCSLIYEKGKDTPVSARSFQDAVEYFVEEFAEAGEEYYVKAEYGGQSKTFTVETALELTIWEEDAT